MTQATRAAARAEGAAIAVAEIRADDEATVQPERDVKLATAVHKADDSVAALRTAVDNAQGAIRGLWRLGLEVAVATQALENIRPALDRLAYEIRWAVDGPEGGTE